MEAFYPQFTGAMLLFSTGMLHGVYHGVGHGLGRVIGGFLFSSYGAQVTFSIFGGLGLIMLLMFGSVNKIFEDKSNDQS